MVRSINKQAALVCSAVVFSLTLGACTREKINIEKSLVEKVLVEFSEERLAHYLKGGEPKSNTVILEKVLGRHSLRLIDFRPVLRRFEPEIEARIMGS